MIELARRLGVSPVLAAQLEQEVRRRFGGDRVYIPNRSPTDESTIRAMAQSMRHDPQRYRKLAQQYGLSERRIRQIVDG